MTRTDGDAEAEVVVVGAGSSGAVHAAALARRGHDVLLVDAGPPHPADGRLEDPDVTPRPGSPFVRWYDAGLPDGSTLPIVRGGVVGGSSAVNGAYFVRPRPADVVGWADGAWSWEDVVAGFVAAEDDPEFAGDPLHGTGGPVPVRRTPPDRLHPVSEAFLTRCVAAGHPHVADLNGVATTGVGRVPRNVLDGRRVDVVTSHLRAEGVGRPRVLADSPVRRVVVDSGRAVAVELSGPDGARRLHAHHVVLAAGALATPAILWRSGIGPAHDLRRLGIPAMVDLPVGAAASEHPVVELPFQPPDATPWGPLVETALHVRSGAQVVEVMPTCRPYAADGSGPLVLRVSLMQPRSQGTVRLRDLDGDPEVELGHLADPEDLADMCDAVRAVTELVAPGGIAPVADPMVARWLGPGPAELADETELRTWVLAHLGTSMHLSGTAPMGPDDGGAGAAVVSPRGAVRGVGALHVVDTSILPTVPSRGPAATAVLLGQLLADDVDAALAS